MYSTIVVALDGSLSQSSVLAHALELADKHRAKLHLCRAVSVPTNMPTEMWKLNGTELENFLVERGEQELKEVQKPIPATQRGGIHCWIGQPIDVICGLVNELDANLIVIGAHNQDRAARMLGTTAAKVANRAPCTVLIVRGP